MIMQLKALVVTLEIKQQLNMIFWHLQGNWQHLLAQPLLQGQVAIVPPKSDKKRTTVTPKYYSKH